MQPDQGSTKSKHRLKDFPVSLNRKSVSKQDQMRRRSAASSDSLIRIYGEFFLMSHPQLLLQVHKRFLLWVFHQQRTVKMEKKKKKERGKRKEEKKLVVFQQQIVPRLCRPARSGLWRLQRL